MYPIGVVADDSVLDDAARHLAKGLEDHGPTALIQANPGDATKTPPQGIETTYTIGAGGAWQAKGREISLPHLLDRLAPDHAYVVVTGESSPRIPQIAVGDTGNPGDALLSVETTEALQPDEVIAALDDVNPYETLESLVTRVKQSRDADKAGAIATFTGRVRERDHADDAPTTHLEFEKYEGVADQRMDAIATDLEARDGVYTVELYHRTGVVESGEDIVFVVVLAGHRDEAFTTVEDGINRLKSEVPLFKKEVTVEEEFWVHERQSKP